MRMCAADTSAKRSAKMGFRARVLAAAVEKLRMWTWWLRSRAGIRRTFIFLNLSGREDAELVLMLCRGCCHAPISHHTKVVHDSGLTIPHLRTHSAAYPFNSEVYSAELIKIFFLISFYLLTRLLILTRSLILLFTLFLRVSRTINKLKP